MQKFQTRDWLGRKVCFGLSVLEPERNKFQVVVRQLDNYHGPSVTNAAENIWRSLERFTGPNCRLYEYYPQEETIHEVKLQRSDEGCVESVFWVPLPESEVRDLIEMITTNDKTFQEYT